MSSELLPFPKLLLQAAILVFLLADTSKGQEPTAALKQADADYRQGVAALNRNDLSAARAKFESVVRLAPAAEQGHSALGAVLVSQGHLPDGIRELQKALSIQPGDHSALENLALAYLQSGAAEKALPFFAKLDAAGSAAKHPLSGRVFESYARALLANGQTEAAIAKLSSAIALEPRYAAWHDELGSIYAQTKNWEKAESALREAIEIKPDLAPAHLHLGSVLQAEQKPGAAEEWAEAARLAPGDANIALSAGAALAAAGRDNQALPLLQQAHTLAPESIRADDELALVLQRANQLEQAIPLLQAVVAAEPKNADALINLGMALTQKQQAKDAVPLLQRAVTLNPANAMGHQDLAAAFIQLNQVDDAVAELKAALKLASDSPQLHYNLGLAFKMKDDAQSAIPELEAAERLDGSAYEPPYVLGLLYMQVARYPEAAAQLEASLKLHPDNGEGWATLGSVYNRMDKLPEAVSALREATRQLPDQADPHLTLAAVLVKQNQPAEAAAERKTAAGLMRTHMNLQRAEVATNSAKSLLVNGKLEDAVAQFREALNFDPNYAEAHLGLAEALEKQGKTGDALAERELAQKTRPLKQ